MKQAFLRSSAKKFIAAAFLSASVLLTSFSSHASVRPANIEILSGENTNIQFTGSTNDALLFKVHINNEKGDNFTVTIKNNNGDVLFSRSFNDVDFQKDFKVLKSENDGNRYYVTVTSTNQSLDDSYVISTVTRTVDDVVINKL